MLLKNYFTLTFFFVLFFLNFPFYSNGLKGAVNLDSWTFDKVIEKFDVSLVKFDITYPYGEKEDEFGKVSNASKNTPNLLIAEVGVQDYGERENSDLSERYNIKRDHFPVIKLFLKGRTNPIPFNAEFKADQIKKFLKSHTSIHLVLEGCLFKFDILANKFMKGDATDRAAYFKEAQDLSTILKLDKDKTPAEIYIKMMQKVIEKGNAFIGSEIDRVKKIMTERMPDAKKVQLQQRLNILYSFTYEKIKEEL